jgi:hypothetical protein
MFLYRRVDFDFDFLNMFFNVLLERTIYSRLRPFSHIDDLWGAPNKPKNALFGAIQRYDQSLAIGKDLTPI